MSERYLLGIDIGTYSSKGVLVRADGSIAASHSVAHGMQMPQAGHFEQDAEQVWWHDFVLIARSLLQSSGVDPRQIAAVGASAIGPCVLPLDEQGRPLRPGILYGIDTRAGAEVAQLYLRSAVSTMVAPVMQLRGFARLALKPGETREAQFTLGPEELALLDRHLNWVVEPGKFEVMVGASSKDIRLRGSFEVAMKP
jgi:hypothetical protein